jgi:hypothetical protein
MWPRTLDADKQEDAMDKGQQRAPSRQPPSFFVLCNTVEVFQQEQANSPLDML